MPDIGEPPNGHSATSPCFGGLYSNLIPGWARLKRAGRLGHVHRCHLYECWAVQFAIPHLSISGIGLPADASSSTNFNMKLDRTAGSYRVLSQPGDLGAFMVLNVEAK